ncbi:vanadium-dependent haloperoxidase [Hymenobacter volaticus]|uniref:Vanadium-dependent haloperoxidase n=1 Tax=Hymenobacter volaticus TaxID=2932254 RepID=A0ABY4GD22_9BACT|nr:vanadium-dependent haloperoxidase [Hymenobacter volaticus]UOQ68820.1 vanadium-dependent haloperoxidase [Hymenobacter volaticus]
MKIAGLACHQSHFSFNRSLQIHAVLALTLTDAFICCWKEKYHSNRIRPETVIRRYLDPEWKPLLQTPPFPEYLSGHSVISTAAATVLEHYFGPTYAYLDSTERVFGLPPRHFTSFRQAAQEAAVSRLYGAYISPMLSGKVSSRVAKLACWLCIVSAIDHRPKCFLNNPSMVS